jgi:hypothetical protein
MEPTVEDALDWCLKRGENVELERATTDMAVGGGDWPVGQRYEVVDAIDRVELRPGTWLPLQGRPITPLLDPQRGLIWIERDARGKRHAIPDEEREVQPGEARVRLIVDASPSPLDRHPGDAPEVWHPAERVGLADELVALGRGDDQTIVAWVAAHGFIGVRATPWERQESVEEIRAALAHLGQARDLVRAIRTLKGTALRAETERLLSLPPGLLERVKADASQPMSGRGLAKQFGVGVPQGTPSWPEAGAFVQALYALASVLQTPLARFLRVDSTIARTADGMRLQGAVAGIGPLGAAYLHTLDEASWPAVTPAGSGFRVTWIGVRRCQRCGKRFTPSRRDRKWCSDRCRWAASKARAGTSTDSPAAAARVPLASGA